MLRGYVVSEAALGTYTRSVHQSIQGFWQSRMATSMLAFSFRSGYTIYSDPGLSIYQTENLGCCRDIGSFLLPGSSKCQRH